VNRHDHWQQLTKQTSVTRSVQGGRKALTNFSPSYHFQTDR